MGKCRQKRRADSVVIKAFVLRIRETKFHFPTLNQTEQEPEFGSTTSLVNEALAIIQPVPLGFSSDPSFSFFLKKKKKNQTSKVFVSKSICDDDE